MARSLRVLTVLILCAASGILAARWAFPLPSLDGRVETTHVPGSAETKLGRAILPELAARPDMSGILAINRGVDAFAARALLSRGAEKTIDARYCIWLKDLTGLPLLDELRDAAERGVRVRLLVDDNGTPDLDAELAALNTLPNMEVRVFNPFNLRSPRIASYLFDFPRLNRRMHNKSFTVDGVVTIIGGRNVGDIYFARDAETQYSDLDLMAVGAVVEDVAADFDAYWNSQSAYPHELLIAPESGGLDRLEAEVSAARADAGAQHYDEAIRTSDLVASLMSGKPDFDWAHTTLVSDNPAKGLQSQPESELVISRLGSILDGVDTSLDLISAYFVPGPRGVEHLSSAAQSGRRVRTLTNSFEATDVIPVHASYVKYRDALIGAGVEVYELKETQDSAEVEAGLGLLGKSASSLHAKTFMLDDDMVFVGSFNFDPRSAFLNCEMGFLVESRALASLMQATFEARMADASWRVTRNEAGALQWSFTKADGTETVTTTEPGTAVTNRLLLSLLGWLPIEWMM